MTTPAGSDGKPWLTKESVDGFGGVVLWTGSRSSEMMSAWSMTGPVRAEALLVRKHRCAAWDR